MPVAGGIAIGEGILLTNTLSLSVHVRPEQRQDSVLDGPLTSSDTADTQFNAQTSLLRTCNAAWVLMFVVGWETEGGSRLSVLPVLDCVGAVGEDEVENKREGCGGRGACGTVLSVLTHFCSLPTALSNHPHGSP